MSDNVTISIGIDTARLRADAAIVKNQLREINREVAAAAKAGDASRLTAGAAEQDKLTRQYTALTRQIRGATAATKENTAANERAAHSFREMGLELGHFAHLAGVSVEGIKALRYGFAGFAVAVAVRGIRDVIKELNDLNNVAKQIGVKPEQLKGAQQVFQRTGQDASQAAAMIGAFNKQWNEGALKQMAASRGGASGVGVFAGGRGSEVNLTDFDVSMRGGRDKSAQFAAIMADPQRALLGRDRNPQDIEGDRKLVAANLLKVQNAIVKNALSEALYSKSFAEAEQQIKKEAGYTEEMAKKILEMPAGMGREAATRKEYGMTFAQAERQIKKDAAESFIGPMQPELFAVTIAPQKHQEALNIYNNATTDMSESWGEATKTMFTITTLTLEAATHLRNWRKLLEQMATGQVPEGMAIPERAPPAPAPAAREFTAPIPANASGGFIRGAGSGTSDSILARLSNGEFVVNAASVRRIGVGFLRGLNSFAAGGLVGAPLPRFAAGGLVSAAAGGGRPVHLHLGGHSFALSGAGSVVDSLVAEAHSQQMRSAGTKPSWYGSRPGGR